MLQQSIAKNYIFSFYKVGRKMHSVRMAKDAYLNMRLDPALKERVDKAAKDAGSSASMIIRVLLEQFVEYCEQSGGHIVMPPEFKKYHVKERNEVCYDDDKDGGERHHLRVAEGKDGASESKRKQ